MTEWAPWRVLGLCLMGACAASEPRPGTRSSPNGAVADVTAVSVSGEDGAYTFAVTVRSDDTGCELYADWWEVLRPDGALVYRRILDHSHPYEQPFTRTGGPVPVSADEQVLVRAHLHPSGYVGSGVQGSVTGGFALWPTDVGFASDLAENDPLPEACWF